MTVIRLLITGADGFVGRHVVRTIKSGQLRSALVLPTGRRAFHDPELGPVRALDITDPPSIEAEIEQFSPSHILHLAGYSMTAPGAGAEADIWNVNLHGTLNVARAMQAKAPKCWLLFAGSGLVYGDSGKDGKPLNEASLLAPSNIYATTKAAADLALGALSHAGLRVIRTRPFNHTGPGQADAFVVASFARQIARIEAGLQPPKIQVGDLTAERDFLDVGDVVDAYITMIARSNNLKSGQILNIASGVPRRVGSILEDLIALSKKQIQIEIDSARMRPSDVLRYVGDASLAKALLGWTPRRDFEGTLAAVLDDWRRRVIK